ncbi:MAG: 4-hydroxy-tetrahydrodipicolinate synthase [Muribaculaceae bacterium]|jgi:dihydrodipicolinate synthase|nr:4-hydroxy-tetrahydrodipicolinate synthase [Muribaculaceae bacterium]CCX48795.1 dihydrodipicolinate synthase [Bacteroides sp. CAG:927]
MSSVKLQGMGVALITPFRHDKTIDFPALERLVEHQIASGIDFLVVLGTTAEAATLTKEERHQVQEFVKQKASGRVPLILGCGGNNTAALVDDLRHGDFSGYSAILSVVPYYNKPSQEGIYQHYSAVAQASPLPVLLYNVPGRTGVNMAAATTLRLAAEYPNIIGVKEASGNFVQMDEIIKHKDDGFMVISGDDGITFPLITLGAVGVISVIGNAFPKEFSRMVRLALDGDYAGARAIHHKFADLFKLMVVDGNPAGVKCLLNAMGYVENELRLPLVPTSAATRDKIHSVLSQLSL